MELSHKKESAMETGNHIIPVSKANVMNGRESGKAFVGNLLSFQVDAFFSRQTCGLLQDKRMNGKLMGQTLEKEDFGIG